MARMREPRFKKSRRLNLNVCGHPKAMNRAGNGQARDKKKMSPFGEQLLEKQRLRGYYEVLEKQFVRYVERAVKSPEHTGPRLIQDLELRLDNMVYRMNFASSIRQARQMVVHGHMLVNGKKVDRPSYGLKPGDVVQLKERSLTLEIFRSNFFENKIYHLPYIEYNEDSYSARLSRLPEREEIPIQIADHLVVEYYAARI